VQSKWEKRQKFSIEEKLVIINQLEKGKRIVDIGIMLELLILEYIQFVIMLIQLQKVLSQELKFFIVVLPCIFDKYKLFLPTNALFTKT
jgi:hypothetical protein